MHCTARCVTTESFSQFLTERHDHDPGLNEGNCNPFWEVWALYSSNNKFPKIAKEACLCYVGQSEDWPERMILPCLITNSQHFWEIGHFGQSNLCHRRRETLGSLLLDSCFLQGWQSKKRTKEIRWKKVHYALFTVGLNQSKSVIVLDRGTMCPSLMRYLIKTQISFSDLIDK